MENYEKKIEELENGVLNTLIIKKSQFYSFRDVLVKHPKYKHIRGEAQQGGTILYTFSKEPRS